MTLRTTAEQRRYFAQKFAGAKEMDLLADVETLLDERRLADELAAACDEWSVDAYCVCEDTGGPTNQCRWCNLRDKLAAYRKHRSEQ